jgi:alcohol/geraniol dehydrogenase (NADP+)
MVQIRAHAIKEKSGSAEPFSYERAVGSHDVLVRITHCSIARGDIQFMDNEWGDARFPLVPGHEIVGIVEALGSEVADLQRGDRVVPSRDGAQRYGLLSFARQAGVD